MKRLLFLCLTFFILFFAVLPSFADQLDDVTKQLDDLKKSFADISKANETNEAQLSGLQKQLDSIKAQVAIVEREIANKQAQVEEGEKAFAAQQKLLNQRAKSYYKNMGKNSFSIVNLLLSENISSSLQNYFYQKTLVDEDRKSIIRIALFVKQITDKKRELEAEKASLAAVKAEVDKQSTFLAGEVSKSTKYLGEIQGKITELAAQRDRLIAGRLASLNLPQSAYTTTGGCSSDLTNGKDPGFSPRFGFFTFGVPHRVGMSQYGAKGRAESGKSAKEILEAYYNAEYKEGYGTDVTIRVAGTNEYGQSFDTSWNIEEYLKHVYEIPSGWHIEALKAQAIAARSYALAYTGNGQRSICPSQSCQVVKQEENSDAWKQAVEQTRGIVLLNGGSPISAYFSSTAGGYTYASGSDIGARPWTKNTQDGSGSYNNFEDVKNNGYDKQSPWFYCDWGSRSSYGGTAWLKSDEVADITNVIMLALKDGGTIGNLYQIDKPNPAGKETWDANKVKQELSNRGITPFNSVDSVSVSADFGGGRSTSVTVSGDAGTKSFDAWSEFKTYFNQRAPANIQIVGPLFNVEKR
jgi:peptidoglycan hydrolase-like amidase/peptidoglycan hydrolase CwlO-like protein